MDSVLNQIKDGSTKLRKIEKIESEEIEFFEDLYIGNLHHVSRHHNNNHCWTMFISKSPTDVVPPNTIKCVTYYLHPTFHQKVVTVEEAPFYLDRRGWGYFDVKADITFKPEYYPNNNNNIEANTECKDDNDGTEEEDNNDDQLPLFQSGITKIMNPKHKKNQSINIKGLKTIRAVHSIHFGSPLVTHHIQSNLPYIIDSAILQKAISEQTDQRAVNRLKRRRRALALQNKLLRQRNSNNNNEEDGNEEEEEEEESDIEDIDMITKQYLPEIVYNGFALTRKKMKEELNKNLSHMIAKKIIDLIVKYSSIFSIGGDDDDNKMDKNELLKTRVVLQNCFSIEFVAYCPILELVVKNCGGCDIQTSNIERSIRIYNSKYVNLYTKGECTSYRFEKCDNINIEAFDTRKRIIFISLLSDNLSFKMFNAYFPNDSSKCVAQFPFVHHINDENKKEKQEIDDNDDNNKDNNNDGGGIINGWKKWFIEGNNECYLTVFRKDRNIAVFGRKTPFAINKGTSLIPLIGN